MWAAACGIAVLYVGSTIPTPLYPLYRRTFGFSELVVTAVYAIYVVGNLTALFAFGRLSDQIGRRRTTLLALGITILSALCFLFAQGTPWLFPARILYGLAAGLGAGALTAWIAELEPRQDRARAAVVASAANLAGLAFGALLAGLLAAYAPWPLRVSYIVFLAVLGILFALIWCAPETIKRPVDAIDDLSLRPRIGIPRGIRLAFVAPAMMAFTAFALGGFYAALAPSVLAQSLQQTSLAVIGCIVALFFASASVTAVATHALRGRMAMAAALVLLFPGLGFLVLAEARHAMALLVGAAILSGAAMGVGYGSSLRIVNEIAPAAQRAEVVSSYLLVCYTANSIPVIGVGLLSLATGTPSAHRVFAIALAVLAVVACATGWRYAPRATPAPSSA